MIHRELDGIAKLSFPSKTFLNFLKKKKKREKTFDNVNSNLQKFFQTCKSELQKKIKNSIQLLFQFSSKLQKKEKKNIGSSIKQPGWKDPISPQSACTYNFRVNFVPLGEIIPSASV